MYINFNLNTNNCTTVAVMDLIAQRAKYSFEEMNCILLIMILLMITIISNQLGVSRIKQLNLYILEYNKGAINLFYQILSIVRHFVHAEKKEWNNSFGPL